MGINLQKGQRVDLTKGNAGLNRIKVGLGWDPVSQKKGGLFGGLLGGSNAANVDCDASVLMLQDDKIKSNEDVIYFGNLTSKCRSVQHSGDNLTGAGDGDDEVITIELNGVPSAINKFVFVVNIYDAVGRKQHFGMIQNAYIRIFDDNSGNELIRYNLTDSYADLTTLVCGEIYRNGNDWKFAAVGTGTTDAKLGDVARRYQ
ncbi:MAG: TerD family protein [Lysinibacillus sp.]